MSQESGCAIWMCRSFVVSHGPRFIVSHFRPWTCIAGRKKHLDAGSCFNQGNNLCRERTGVRCLEFVLLGAGRSCRGDAISWWEPRKHVIGVVVVVFPTCAYWLLVSSFVSCPYSFLFCCVVAHTVFAITGGGVTRFIVVGL